MEMYTEFKMTEEKYLKDKKFADSENSGWVESYSEWSAKKDNTLPEELCKRYFVGYALSPIIVHNNIPRLAVYIPLQNTIEETLDQFKNKKLLLHQVDSKYIRAVIL